MEDKQQHTDTLLERYLALLHEYTTLRERLSHLQSDIFHGIARANFTAERGLRYGRDQYDDRMQASRVLRIEREEGEGEEDEEEEVGGSLRYTVTRRQAEEEEEGEEEEEKDMEAKRTEAKHNEEKSEKHDEKQGSTTDDPADTQEQDTKANEKKQKDPSKKKDDPLRWFGIFTPMPLRTAQTQSIEAVEQVIPQLVTISHKMLDLEIEVRRARKKRSKAQAAADKKAREDIAATPVEAS
jgi:hypothetical protein